MGRGQPTSRNGGATPASSLIIFLEQRVAELETQRDEAEQFASNMENWIARAEAAEAKVVELHETYARWKADWVDIDKTREAKITELETRLEWREDGHDGIYCRDETISLMTDRIKDLETENNDLMTISIPELQLDLKDAQATIKRVETRINQYNDDKNDEAYVVVCDIHEILKGEPFEALAT